MNNARTSLDQIRLIPLHKNEHPAYDEIAILINGRNLIELVAEVEAPFAAAEGLEPGGYAGLTAHMLGSPSDHLLGRAINGDKVALLCCDDCGMISCWGIEARITMLDDRVIWEAFEQNHRRGTNGETEFWDYGRFGPFVFDKQEYLAALAAISAPAPPRRPVPAWLYRDPIHGWAIELPDYLSELAPGDTPPMLDLGGEWVGCAVIDTVRTFWQPHPTSARTRWWVEQSSQSVRLLYIPGQPDRLARWMERWIDLELFVRSREEWLFAPGRLPHMREATGSSYKTILPVGVEVLAPNQTYSLVPAEQAYREAHEHARDLMARVAEETGARQAAPAPGGNP
ncbi:MAG TPA: hypothetical protein VD886_11425 [Herpetosiphonaceae bacterium]|nr:hypothetical protein [Herpetosiphonaceae bacterium]